MRTSEGTIITLDKVIFTCSTTKPDRQAGRQKLPGIPLADVTENESENVARDCNGNTN